MKLLSDLDLLGKRVFLRGDLDIPIVKGNVEDVTRLENLLLTISYLISKNCQVLVAGHIGRPQETQNFNLSTNLLLETFSSLLNTPVTHFKTLEAAKNFKGTLGLLENLRFWSGEEKNDEGFAKKLANLADIYVNEAFAASHRNHASIVGVPKLIPAAAGFHFQKEVEVLTKVLKKPTRPCVVVIGGAKIETKLPIIENMVKIADWVLVGGALPSEISNFQFPISNEKIIIAQLKPNGKDIDEDSIKKFKSIISEAKTIVWNGPMGVFEEKGQETGTKEVAEAVANSHAEKIVGGGETIFALKKFNLLDKMDWVSSGGGAMLEFLAKGTLAGIEALK